MQDTLLSIDAVTVVRKSFDARVKQRNFVYVVDVDAAAAARAGAAPRFKQGQIERWMLHMPMLSLIVHHYWHCRMARSNVKTLQQQWQRLVLTSMHSPE